MKYSLIVLMAITLFASCQNRSKNTETMEKLAKQEIESLLMTYKETLNTSNAEKATSLYTSNGIFMPSGAPSAMGTENIQGAYEFVFSQIQLNIEFYIEEITIENKMGKKISLCGICVSICPYGKK